MPTVGPSTGDPILKEQVIFTFREFDEETSSVSLANWGWDRSAQFHFAAVFPAPKKLNK